MNQYIGKMLRVDLSTGEISKEALDDELVQNYIGGRGFNSRLAYNEIKPGIDPLSPENVLLMAAGPLGGTIAPASNRLSIAALSPQTGILGYANVGDSFAPSLRWAGYEQMVFTGKSPEPVYLWIDDDKVELRPAKHLWGKGVHETVHQIRKELESPEATLLSIGPAGENLVRFACVVGNLHRAAGRCGMGAVMGSKNLKSIAVRGTGTVKVARPQEFMKLAKAAHHKVKNSVLYPEFSIKGTSGMFVGHARMGIASVWNHQRVATVEEISKVGYEGQSQYFTRSLACYSCSMHCSHRWAISDGPYAGEKGSGMEYGVSVFLTSILGNFYVPSAFKGLNLVNDYGMDTTEFGCALAAAFEWYQKGIITKEDTGGMALEWGNYETILDLIGKIARREGFGDLLAEGAIRAAKVIGKGAEKFVTDCKGLSTHGADMRSVKGTILSLGICNKGADVMDAAPAAEFLSPEERKHMFGSADYGDPSKYTGKARLVFDKGIDGMIGDLFQICKFNTSWAWPGMLDANELVDMYNAAIGTSMTKEDVMMVAERIHTLERAFQARSGITKKDDFIKGPMTEEPVADGPLKGERVDPEKYLEALEEYYELAGWDMETGVPTRARLEKLGLGFVADDLEREGKLLVFR